MNRFRFVGASVLVVALVGGPALAQQDPHAACAAPPSYVPAQLLERRVALRSGTGNSHDTVTTKSRKAQAFYNQGLNYLESYVWIEAVRSFRQALRHDANLAMAYIGLSRAYSGLENSAGAKQFLDRAKALSARASDRERRRIEIREKQLVAMENLEDSAAFLAYKRAIDSALAVERDNVQLFLLRGNAEENNASGRGQRGGETSVAFYEAALKLEPECASAHHFLVHSFENIGNIEKALVHGEAYARLAPSIPHAAHMWAHDLRRVGRVDEAIAQFSKADKLERAYYAAEKINPSHDWHHGHNLDLLSTCYEHKGQMKLAEKVMREATSLEPVNAGRAFNMKELPSFLIHRGRYAEALEAANALTSIEYAQSRAVGHALAGQALIGLGRIDAARTELVAARREAESIPRITPGIAPNRSSVEPWIDALNGEILLRTGKIEEGRAVLKNVQRVLRAIPGPDAWSQTLFRLESIARSAREAGDWELARYTAEQMLDHDRAYGGSHFAMALVLRNENDTANAVRHFEEAKRYWRDADPDLTEMGSIARAIASN
jgi:tetratricopeptide (TPR) repeat protein